jgi:HK97 family phage portal protein
LNLVESIFRGGIGILADAGGAPAPWDDFWYNPVGQTSAAGMRVSADTAKRLTVILACVTARGRALSILPCKIRTDLAAGGSKVVSSHPLYDLLAYQPNSYQTAADFFMMMQGHVDLRGNAFAEKVPGPRGPVDQLLPMHPDRVQVEVLKNSGRLRYRYNDPLTGSTKVLMQDEVFHLRDWSDSGYVGQSRVSMMADTIGIQLARQDFTARFLKNDARTGVIYEGGLFKTDADRSKWVEKARADNTGPNRGKPLWVPAGMKVTQVGFNLVDVQNVESMKATDVQICNGMGVLPHTVGIDAGKAATFASTEQFNIMDAQRNIHPMIRMWEQCIQRDLIVSDRYYANFSMAALLRGDNATRFAGYATAITYGWMCPDDVRELEDLNPIPGGAGKVFWRSANLLPLKQLAAPAPKPFPPAAPKPADDEGDPENNDPANDDSSDDGAGGDSTGNDAAAVAAAVQALAAKTAQLEMMALGTAERCVRKEVSGVNKLIAQSAGVYQVTEFYCDHARWVAEAFHMGAAGALDVKIGTDIRAQHLSMLLAGEDDEFHAGAQVWVESIAATEPAKLAALAVKGIQ